MEFLRLNVLLLSMAPLGFLYVSECGSLKPSDEWSLNCSIYILYVLNTVFCKQIVHPRRNAFWSLKQTKNRFQCPEKVKLSKEVKLVCCRLSG